MRGAALPLAGAGESPFSSCLSNRRWRVQWGLRASVLFLHVIFIGALFVLDGSLIWKLRDERCWHTVMYLILVVAVLFQYFLTSCSSPGYVVDAMKAANAANATFVNVSNTSTKQSAHENKSLDSTRGRYLMVRQSCQTTASAWFKIVMELYPPGQSTRNWTCVYCNIVQPPRAKHCNECHRCVLQFDHHCAWLGTCIGRGNHCRFWWFVFGETSLCIWTGKLYITFLRSSTHTWWMDLIVIVLFSLLILGFLFLLLLLLFHSYLLLTDQTTYEIIRRRRILYLRDIPQSVHPFSRGICRNLYASCCSRESIYTLEEVPSMGEMEARGRPYTCGDIIICRCC